MANTTLYIQAKTGDSDVNYTATAYRQMVAATYPLPGVISSSAFFTDLQVTPRAAGANMSVDVAPGAAVVACTSIQGGGSYYTAESASTNLTIPSAPGTGTLRHRIVERVYDPQNDASVSTYTSKPFVVAGTNTSGVAPALPDNCVELAQVTVAAGTAAVNTGNITDMRATAAQPGQVLARSTWTSNTDSSADVGAQAIVAASATTIVVSKPCFVVVTWEMFGRSVAGTPSGTSIEGSLFRSSSRSAPSTSSTELAFYNRPFSEMGWIDITGSYVDRVDAGIYTYAMSKLARTGKSYIWGNRPGSAPQVAVQFAGLA